MAKVLVRVYLVTNGPYVAENVNVCKQIGGTSDLSRLFIRSFLPIAAS